MSLPATMFGAEMDATQARILVVDDDDTNLAVLRHMLERAGYANLVTINDPRVALERFCTFEPDLVLLDLHMPGLDGFQVMAQLAPLVPDDAYVPVLVLTADITDDTRERALAAGAHDFLTKPFRYNELLLRLNTLLETRALTTRLHRENAVLEARVQEQHGTDRAEGERRRTASRRTQEVIDADETGRPSPSGHRLTMVYQPIVDLHTGEIRGAEALARFGTEPRLSTETWFLEAAEVGLGRQLELTAIRRAVDGLRHLPETAFLSLNASAATISSPALSATIRDLPTERLVIELTEHEHGIDPRSLMAPVAQLRALGARLAIDDAGAGATNLQQLLDLAPEVIKLDRRFLDSLTHDPVRQALARALVSFAAQTNATVVAEGLATVADLEAVRSIGIGLGQGRFLGAPMALPFDPSRLGSVGSPRGG